LSDRPKKTEDNEDRQPPINTYINNLQRLLYNSSMMLSTNNALRHTYKPLRILIANLPPFAKQHFVKELEQLTNSIPTQIEIEQIYNKIFNWVYTHILVQGYRVKPFISTSKENFDEVIIVDK